MRLATILRPDGETRSALIVNRDGQDVAVDLAESSGGRIPSDVSALLRLGPEGLELAQAQSGGPAIPAPTLRAPLPRPGKLLLAGSNYLSRILEGGNPAVVKERVVPELFIKPQSTIVGHNATINIPEVAKSVSWEVELAAVIGRRAHKVPAPDGLAYVAGYTIVNDVTAGVMDWHLSDRQATRAGPFFDWLHGKWCDGFTPIGPWIVTSDEIDDPQNLEMTLEVNGIACQRSSTSEMIFTVTDLIAFASQFMTLEPGDVLSTGTPANVPGRLGTLSPGDRMVASIQRIGSLTTEIGQPSTG